MIGKNLRKIMQQLFLMFCMPKKENNVYPTYPTNFIEILTILILYITIFLDFFWIFLDFLVTKKLMELVYNSIFYFQPTLNR